ncbi:unnamed protein product, partial [marine sediment metagenome]
IGAAPVGKRPLSAVTPVSPQAGDKKVELAYDYMGRRIEKKVYDWNDQAGDWEATPSLHRKFVWGGTGGSSASGWLLLLELDCGTGDPPVETVVRKYTWGLDLAGMSGQSRDRKGAGMSGQSRDREGAGMSGQSRDRKGAGMSGQSRDRKGADAACGAAALEGAGGTLDRTPSRQGQVAGLLAVLNAAEEAAQAPTK